MPIEHFLQKNSFHDFDEFSHFIQAWDLDFRQLDTGECKTDLLQFATAKSLLTHAQFNRRFDQRGSAPPGNWTFAIFAEQSTPIVWHEQEISTNNIVVYKPGSEIDCVSRPGFEVYTLSYPEEHLNEIAANLGLPEINKLVNDSDNFVSSRMELSESRRQLYHISETFRRTSLQTDNTTLLCNLEIELPEQILLTLAKSRPARSISTGLRNMAIKRVKEYLSDFPNEPVTVTRLCSITGASERTLQYAFLDHYGVTPKTYLKNFRLNNVRRELWKSDPDSTQVNDVTSLWGFWHMGQFAADYRKLFGELPSETLQRKM